MNWMAKLYETYEQGLLLDLPDDEQLMPVSHTSQNAHINVVLDGNGCFLRASVLNKYPVMVPATEDSATRTGRLPPPHPLHDKLQYVAADYPAYGGKRPSFFKEYLNLLSAWCDSEHSNESIRLIRKYVSQGHVIRDLVAYGILACDEKNILLTPKNLDELVDGDKFPIFKSIPKDSEKKYFDQGSAFACWSIEIPGREESKIWRDKSVSESWIAYYASRDSVEGFCSITGQVGTIAIKHPSKIIPSEANAKLVSSDDTDGFTYRGRFTDTKDSKKEFGLQAGNVGSITSQKAHNALRWLITQRKQAFFNNEQVVVSWAISGKEIPSPVLDLASILEEELELLDEDAQLGADIDVAKNIGQQFGIAFKRYMKGYCQKFSNVPTESIVIMGLDSATAGRVAITYYRDFMAKEYLDVISQWHTDFAWPQRVTKEYVDAKGKTKSKVRWLPGAPTPWAILNACYGDIVKSNDALKKQITERLLPCIVERKPLPIDLLQLAVRKASNPSSGEQWEWERNIGVACALYRGFYLRHPKKYQRRNYDMALDMENCSRDYLYGRLLALAERLEEIALSAAGVNRPTTANRLMQRFADRPYETWLVINKQLDPYIRQLKSSRPGFLFNIRNEIDMVMDKFNRDEYMSPKALSGEFLLGFHCQRMALHKKPETEEIKQIAVAN